MRGEKRGDKYVMLFDSHLPNLLTEVLSNPSCAILRVPINITKGILAELAKLAIEIDDNRLHVLMLRLGLYDVSASERVKEIDKLNSQIRREKRIPPSQKKARPRHA